MSVIARPYTPADKADCLALFDGNCPPFFDPGERPLFEAFLDDPAGEYFVLVEDKRVLGCGGFTIDLDEATGERSARFTWGMVDREAHGKGLGRLLTETRLARIRELPGLAAVNLGTTPMIAPFFRHMGFAELETVKDGYAPGMDKVRMAMPLNDAA